MSILKRKKVVFVIVTLTTIVVLAHQPLQARERRGATVEVTLTDGRLVYGELLAVKADTLLIYDQNARQGKNIELQQVAKVKLLKEPKVLRGLGIGLGVGLALSALYCNTLGRNKDSAGIMYLYLVPPAFLIGGSIGVHNSLSEKFNMAGESLETSQLNLERLKRYAREQDFKKLATE